MYVFPLKEELSTFVIRNFVGKSPEIDSIYGIIKYHIHKNL